MNKLLKCSLALLVALAGSIQAGHASAQIDCPVCTNAQAGDISSDTDMGGESESGDANAGQVVGVVSSGDASLDSTNRSEDMDVESGDTEASNSTAQVVGQNTSDVLEIGVARESVSVGIALNAQAGDNTADIVQAAEAASGDAVGGQVIGVVTSADGSADIVADNTSRDADISTGNARAANDLAAFTGQTTSFLTLAVSGAFQAAADVEGEEIANAQAGNNELAAVQEATASTGDGVGGQVIGVVSAGDTSVDATNTSDNVDIQTGDSESSNAAAPFTGQNTNSTQISIAFVDVTTAGNAQSGDNISDIEQTARATSGDGVAGQVAGVVTSAGGSADVVGANTSTDVDIESGDPTTDNDLASFVGQATAPASITTSARAADVVVGLAANAQDGNNELDVVQEATAATGGGVGGQIIGVVSAGDTSVDATNASEDVDVDTGDAEATNDVEQYVGQTTGDFLDVGFGIAGVEADIVGNAQDGDNTFDLAQTAQATTGDGVGGQVAGIVTSAGGSADVVAANTSRDVDVDTGDADADNDLAAFTGQATGTLLVTVGLASVEANEAGNAQDGNNSSDVVQTAQSATGDGVGGQVLGVVSAGEASVDATNTSEDVDVATGDADTRNVSASVTGQNSSTADPIIIGIAGVDVGTAGNAQSGDNAFDLAQTAQASTGDGVGGQVAGVVTSAGGSADVVAANTSDDVNVDTGDADATNGSVSFTGQTTASITFEAPGQFLAADVVADFVSNAQDGDNTVDLSQTAQSTTGDGVGGQVLGVVSAGDTAVDASNTSEDLDIETGDATTSNGAVRFVGQSSGDFTEFIIASVDVGFAANALDGDNSSSLDQTAQAISGDAVGGQVAGVVTSPGASADLVLANLSRNIDLSTGNSLHTNSEVEFVGQSTGVIL